VVTKYRSLYKQFFPAHFTLYRQSFLIYIKKNYYTLVTLWTVLCVKLVKLFNISRLLIDWGNEFYKEKSLLELSKPNILLNNDIKITFVKITTNIFRRLHWFIYFQKCYKRILRPKLSFQFFLYFQHLTIVYMICNIFLMIPVRKIMAFASANG